MALSTVPAGSSVITGPSVRFLAIFVNIKVIKANVINTVDFILLVLNVRQATSGAWPAVGEEENIT